MTVVLGFGFEAIAFESLKQSNCSRILERKLFSTASTPLKRKTKHNTNSQGNDEGEMEYFPQ